MRFCGESKKAMGGVSLVEVLVSVLIVSFGLLALGALIANAARYNKTTEFRSVATLLANDLADRMRANKAAANLYVMQEGYSEPAKEPAKKTCADAANCTPAELAAVDLAEWQTSLFYDLPGGSAYVSIDAADQSADLWVAWLDPDASQDEAKRANECPPAFEGSNPMPRCAYFRIGL
jgi:type IV pilus assembly protein PilV